MLPKSPEIQAQIIETPEELISKLKEKSKDTLAKKVEDVVKGIGGDSKSKWEKLKTELTSTEKAEIKEVFQNSGIDIKLDELEKKSATSKNIETALKVGGVGAVAGVVGMEASKELSDIKNAKGLGLVDKVVGFFGKIGDWFGGITDGIKSWFASSFPSLAKWFGIEGSNGSEGNLDKKNDSLPGLENGEKKIDATPEGKIDHKYMAVTTIFSRMFGKQFNKNSSKEMNELFAMREFRNKKYSQIRPIYNEYVNKKDKKGLAEKFNIKGFKDDDVFTALATIVSANSHGNKLILNIYKHKKEDVENKTVEEIMIGLYSDLHLIENFEKIEGPEDFVSGKVSSIFDLHAEKDNNGEIKVEGGLSDKALGLGLSTNLIFFGYTRDIAFNKFKDPNFITGVSENELNEKDRKILMEKIIPFGLKISETINSKFSLGFDLKSYFNDNSLTLSQIISLYTITGGETDYDKMNSLEKTYLFAKIPGIIADKDPETSAKYISRVFDKIESNVDIPEDVKIILLNIGNTLKDSALDGLKYAGSGLWGFAQERPFATAFIALMLYFLPLKAKRVSMHSSLKSFRK